MAQVKRGLRGSGFEEEIGITNDTYRREGLALVQKAATPIAPVRMRAGRISEAYFKEKSTVDYIGAVQGVPVAFDAKETKEASLPLANIHPHQVDFMKDMRAQDGLSFLLVRFARDGAVYLLPVEDLLPYWEGKEGRRSVPRSAFREEYRVGSDAGAPVHYLPALAAYLGRASEGQT